MPSTIPHDPSLVLGNIVDPDKIKELEDIASLQEPVDATKNELNALISSKRSLDMTLQEMINMNTDKEVLDKLSNEINKLKSEIANKAVFLADETITAQQAISKLRKSGQQQKKKQKNIYLESPIDYTKSKIEPKVLSSESLVMDAQYFRYESNKEDSDAHSMSIASYVSKQCSESLAPTYGAQMGDSARAAMESQHSKHKIEGTLVITANCTHKTSRHFDPCTLDPEKGVLAWNFYHPDRRIDTASKESLEKNMLDKDSDAAGLYLLSGATYGSSFVGLLHTLQNEETDESQEISNSLAESITKNLCLANHSGRFGLDEPFSSNIKKMINSASNIQSHASIIAMGLIPSIKSNSIATTVQNLKPNPEDVMSQLIAIQGVSNTQVNTMAVEAEKAKTGESYMQLNNSYISEVVSKLGSYDDKNNQVIDANSMMAGFDDYLQKAIKGDCGVPIGFFLKPITSRQLVEAWLRKFYPEKFIEKSSSS